MDKKIKTIILIIIIVIIIFIICSNLQLIKRVINRKNKSKHINKDKYEKLKDYVNVLYYEYLILYNKPVNNELDVHESDKKEFDSNFDKITKLTEFVNNNNKITYDKILEQYEKLKDYIINYKTFYEINIDSDDKHPFYELIKPFRDNQLKIIKSSNNDPEYEYITKKYEFKGGKRIYL